MSIFCQYCDELRVEAVKNGIRLQVLSTETEQVSQYADFVRYANKRSILTIHY